MNTFQLTALPSLPPSVYVAGVVAGVVAILLVLTKRWHGRFSLDGLVGVQKNHAVPTPRVGGLAIILGVLAAWMVAQPGRSYVLGTLLLAGLPAFLFGFAEDVTKRVGVVARLLATMASGVLGWWLTGVSITAVEFPLFDALLIYPLVSVLFTAFAVGGVANAVNIVDGVNGLASGFVVVALVGLSMVAGSVGDVDLSVACLALAAAVIGFWFVNWPWGWLFLGDGGSYFGGFALAWVSVLLIERNEGVTAFVPLLVCVHPVTEVLFSIYRRRLKRMSPGAPDRLHLHTLVLRRVVRPRMRQAYPHDQVFANRMCNSVTGLLLALATVPAVLVAQFVVNSPVLGGLACLSFALGYVTMYARLVRFHWCSPISFLFVRLQPRLVMR